MDSKPTLKEFLKNNPGKGLNDYYEEYGDIKDSRSFTPVPVQPVKPVAPPPKSETIHIVDRSQEFPAPPSPPKHPGRDILTAIASLMVIAAFFLPWISVEGFKAFKDVTTIPGYELFNSVGLIYESPPPPLFYTIFLIPVGAAITLLGELVHSWVIRIMGQVFVVAFSIYWAFEIHQIFLYAQEALKMEDLELFKFVQYGTYISFVGAILLFVDLLRTLFGDR